MADREITHNLLKMLQTAMKSSVYLTNTEKRILAIALPKMLDDFKDPAFIEATDAIVKKLDLRSSLKSVCDNRIAWLRAYGLEP